ncbi:MAG: protein kinase, partial [Gemmatimonadota bacterium]
MSAPTRLAAALADRYTVERELGAGGMATVYLAADLKHHRKVAIKVLRPELAAVIGAERFLAEIRTTANLQHPHILALIDSGETDGILWYVMPFVEGETLRDRINHEKQLPIGDAIRIATEVAAALDYAHRHGVIHRDIKPENILLHDGSALVADFGIALAASSGAGTRMTETGMSLGTPHYMSPEQAMGEREITARSDVYALGCITYEMLVGEPPFNGPTAQAIMARVMTEDPRGLTAQRKTIPPGVEAAVFTALEKLPADRFASTAEFAAALANPNTTTARTSLQPSVAVRRRGWLVTAGLAALTLFAGYLIGGRNGSGGARGNSRAIQATLALGDSLVVRAASNIRLAIDPSGERIVFIGSERGQENALYLRELNQPTAQKLPDTDGAVSPFFSPDGQSVGFFVTSSGKTAMKVLDLGGGSARTLVPDSLPSFGGASWGDDGQIYFTQGDRGLSRISSAGGATTHISRIDSVGGVLEQDFPDVLPGSRYAVVMLWKGAASSNHIGVVDLKTGALRDLTSGTYARYVAPGYLAIGTADGQILVAPFDP